MSKQAIDKSGEGQKNKVITVTSTLPPARREHQSGRFLKTYSVRDSIKDPRGLLNPTVGGALLRERAAWENLPGEIKTEALPHMLDYIAKGPIPSDRDIDLEIGRIADIEGKRLEVRKSLGEIKELPELIRHAISEHMDREISADASVSINEILQDTLDLAIEALDRINKERIPAERATGKYCLIAHDILQDRSTGKPTPLSDNDETDGDDDNERPTIPETPAAIKKNLT